MGQSLELPSNAIIPYHVQINKNLRPAAKIFYGQIYGLSVKYGYLFAKDEQLSEMTGESIRLIQKWLDQLEKEGLIFRVTRNVLKENTDKTRKWIKTRKIYFLREAFNQNSNNFSEHAQKDMSNEHEQKDMSNEHEQKGVYNKKPLNKNIKDTLPFKIISPKDRFPPDGNPPDGKQTLLSNKETISNKELLPEEQKPPESDNSGTTAETTLPKQPKAPAAVVVSSLNKLQIKESLKKKLSRQYTVLEIDIAVDRTLRWTTRTSDEAAIMHLLKNPDSWNDVKTPEETQVTNAEYLKQLTSLDRTKLGPYQICVGNAYIEFCGGMKVHHFNISEKEFIGKVKEFMEKLRKLE